MLALTAANLKMMVRNRQTAFWALFFPLMLVVMFGLFSKYGGSTIRLAVIDLAGTTQSQELLQQISGLDSLTLEETPVLSEGLRRIEDGSLDFLLVLPAGFGEAAQSAPALTYSSNDPQRNQLVTAVITNLVQKSQAGENPEPSTPEALVTTEIPVQHVSFFDVALLGLVGLGIMTNSIISIAVKISTYRNQSILKRMLVTPLPIWKYFAAEIVAHLLLALIQAAVILSVGVFVFGAQVNGNVAWIFIIVILGSLVFLNLGFIVSAWADTPAAASGMGNAIALPMLFLAGAFFSTTSLPWLLPYAVQALPLTPMISAMRDVSIYNAQIWDVWPQLAALAGWVVITALVAVKVFRFR